MLSYMGLTVSHVLFWLHLLQEIAKFLIFCKRIFDMIKSYTDLTNLQQIHLLNLQCFLIFLAELINILRLYFHADNKF